MPAPLDPLFTSQWHLGMLGNLNALWDHGITGAGVTVAIYDDGVQFSHPDLAANYNADAHFRYNGATYAPNPQGPDDAHGTACAGLIAAVDNNGRGGVGVAHGATITGMDYLNDLQYTSGAFYTAVMRWAAGFDIMSDSWGVTPVYDRELNLNVPGTFSAIDAGHFAWVSANGRNGLGTIVVKAAGNESMNANGDGANASRHTITVAATDQTGFAAYYSNFGASILVTAPAASVTTDLIGTEGYGTGDYITKFGGTSAATPVVAGVVALMLDANDQLGWRDVQSILAASASHTGSTIDRGPSATEVGRWITMGGDHWNGGGAIYHQSYGFGMVNAYAAARMAEVWTRMKETADTSANEVRLAKAYVGPDVLIPDTDGIAATAEARIGIAVAQDIQIDSIQVTIDITHSFASDLVIFLRTPAGQMIPLFNREGETANPNENFGETLFDNGLKWTFAVEAVRGMSSQGTWQIVFHDRVTEDTGTVSDARIDFYGSAHSESDIHTFTDDFAMLRNQQADRRVISDTNGGTDWLNFAAMTGNISINMAAGGAIKKNGVTLATFAAGTTDFERLQTGDGADWLTGNELANAIYGGRGNDQINGRQGADRLFGEAGNDILNGGADNDVLSGGRDNDTFIFARGFGRDTVTGWADNQDSLWLDDAIWGGGRNVPQILTSFGDVVAGSVVLSFTASMVIVLQGFSNLNALSDDIVIY